MRLKTIIFILFLFAWIPVINAAKAVEATLQGTLLSSEGGTYPNAELVFVNAISEKSMVAVTDENGRFGLLLPVGEYEIYQKESSGQTFLGRVNLADSEVRGIELKIPKQEDTSLAAIRDYGVGIAETVQRQETQSIAELINPFPAKKRGRFFGSIYEFHRNDNFDARNYFDPFGEPLPEYKRNQFGFTLGFFATQSFTLQGTYEGLRIIQGSTLLSHIPTKEMKRGDFSELENPLTDPMTGELFPGNIIPADRISPAARNILAAIPDPNREDPDRNHVNNDPLVRNQDVFTIRGDWEPEGRSKLTAEYHLEDVDRQNVHPLPQFNSVRTQRFQSASVSFNRSVTDRFLTYSRIDFNRGRSFSLSKNAGNNGLLESLGIAGLSVNDPFEEGYPQFYVTDYTSFGDGNSPSTFVRNQMSFDFSTTYVHNTHTIRAGFAVGGIQLNNFRSDSSIRGMFAFSGQYTGDAFADFLLGYTKSGNRGIGENRSDLRRGSWEFFLRDQWKIVPNFDFQYGVNYRYVDPYYSIRNDVSTFYPLLFDPPVDGEIVIEGTPRANELGFDRAVQGSMVFPDRNDWSPRLGFNYSPLGSNRFVIRGSYSIYYDPPDDYFYTSTLGRNYPFYYQESVSSEETIPTVELDDPFSTITQTELTFRGIEPRLSTPYIQYWRLSIENEIARNWNLEATYTGRKGTSMTRSIPGNVPLPGPGLIQERRPNTEFGRFTIINDGGRYTGQYLDLSASRRFADGISFRSGFGWDRVIDDAIWDDPNNPRDLHSEMAAASWVAQKHFFLNYIFDIPLASLIETEGWTEFVLDGWRLSGITEIRDGRPFSVTVPGDPNNDGIWGDRPNRIGSGVLDKSARSIDMWFNTAHFTDPPEYGFGDAGRNILKAPGYQAWDISVIKQTRFNDGDLIEFRVEFFNAFNNVNFYRPNSSYGTSSFGKIFGADRAREIEVALKYSF
jgi:hypothetical protein